MSRRQLACIAVVASGFVIARRQAAARSTVATGHTRWLSSATARSAAGLTRAPGTDSLALARYTAAGRLDAGFGRDGKVVTPGIGQGSALAIEPDGKVVAASWRFVGNKVTGTLVRYDAGGNLDGASGTAAR